MTRYLIRRTLIMLFTVFVVSVASFAVIQLPPGDYATRLFSQISGSGANVDPRLEARLREQYGLNEPVHVQYGKWISNVLQGRFGYSFVYKQDASALIRDRFPLTMTISLATILFVWLLAIPIGIFSAVRKYSAADYSVSFLSFLGMSIPDFMLALIFMFVSYRFFGQSVAGLFSPEYVDAPWSFGKVMDLLGHLWVPVVLVGVASVAGLIRTMRANLLDELDRPYVETARAKGLSEARLLWKYPVRHALNPFVSTIGWTLPVLISGEVLVSKVLNLPTTGPVLFSALQAQDLYVASGFILLLSVLTVIGTFISDLLLAWLDPRIRLE